MFEVVRGGCNSRHPSSYIRDNPEGNSTWMLLIIKTPAIFTIMSEQTRVSPATAVIISPFTSYRYLNPEGEYIDDWLHFSFPEDAFTLEGLVRPNTFFMVNDTEILSMYVRQVLWESTYNDSAHKQENTDHLMHILLNHLSASLLTQNVSHSYNPYRTRFQEIRITMQSTMYNSMNADEFADSLGISKSHFQHLYKEFFGISFQQDYIQMRIAYACEVLETSDIPMEQVAEICGYSNEVHFYRQFKSIAGMTPSRYRKRFRNQS